MNVLLVIIGFIILVAGHQLYWLYVGGICVLLTSHILREFQVASTQMNLIISSLAVGVIGIMLTHFSRKIMVILATAIAGGYISYFLPSTFGWNTDWLSWITIVITGVICAVIIYFWYAIPLTIISAIFGATIIVEYMNFGSISTIAGFLVLCIFGIATQLILMQYGTPESS